MLEYKIVEHENKRKFEEIVKAHLDVGWKLQGGVSVSVYYDKGTFTWYAQAMVRKVDWKDV